MIENTIVLASLLGRLFGVHLYLVLIWYTVEMIENARPDFFLDLGPRKIPDILAQIYGELVLIGVPREIPGCWISKSVILENILPERKGLWDTNTTFVAKHH